MHYPIDSKLKLKVPDDQGCQKLHGTLVQIEVREVCSPINEVDNHLINFPSVVDNPIKTINIFRLIHKMS